MRGHLYFRAHFVAVTGVSLFTAHLAAGQGQPPTDPPAETNESSARFGQAGQLAISSGFSLNIDHLGYSETEQTAFSVEAYPAADFFVLTNVSVGGSLLFGYHQMSIPLEYGTDRTPTATAIDQSSVSYGVSARIGINVPLGERVSFWPNASLGVWSEKFTTTPTVPGLATNRNGRLAYGDNRETAVWTRLYAPVLVHPTSHFSSVSGLHFSSTSATWWTRQRTGERPWARPARLEAGFERLPPPLERPLCYVPLGSGSARRV